MSPGAGQTSTLLPAGRASMAAAIMSSCSDGGYGCSAAQAPADSASHAHPLDSLGHGEGGLDVGARVVVVQHRGRAGSHLLDDGHGDGRDRLVAGHVEGQGEHEVRQPHPEVHALAQAAGRVLEQVVVGRHESGDHCRSPAVDGSGRVGMGQFGGRGRLRRSARPSLLRLRARGSGDRRPS